LIAAHGGGALQRRAAIDVAVLGERPEEVDQVLHGVPDQYSVSAAQGNQSCVDVRGSHERGCRRRLAIAASFVVVVFSVVAAAAAVVAMVA